VTVHRLPERTDAIIFDVDSTLYTCPAYAEAQIQGQIQRLALELGVAPQEMELRVEERRELLATCDGGRKPSLGNVFVSFGIPISESVRWREELIDPADFLTQDTRLRDTLLALRSAAAIGVVTNNPAAVGRRTLAALGVEDLFPVVVGLDTCGVSKPHRAPFLRAAAELGASAEHCLAVGDRFDIDIALPLELGMGGVLVDGVEDVYRLPELLSSRY
jgi:phosphoglycolate phosphatase/putative hydrolase of the HAD superfamily